MPGMVNRKSTRPYASLKAWRAAQGLTQFDACLKLGLNYRTYIRYERGETHLSGAKLRALAAQTNVAIESLAGVA